MSYDEDDDEYVFNEIAKIIYGEEATPEAEMLPVNTVLSRKHYAVRFLRKRLEELYGDVMASPSVAF